MDQHIEIRITEGEIRHFGRDAAIERAMNWAWRQVISNTRPKRLLVLQSSEQREVHPGTFGISASGMPNDIVIQCHFLVDEE